MDLREYDCYDVSGACAGDHVKAFTMLMLNGCYSGEELQSGNTKDVEVQCDTAEGKFPESCGELAVDLTFSQSEAVAVYATLRRQA